MNKMILEFQESIGYVGYSFMPLIIFLVVMGLFIIGVHIWSKKEETLKLDITKLESEERILNREISYLDTSTKSINTELLKMIDKKENMNKNLESKTSLYKKLSNGILPNTYIGAMGIFFIGGLFYLLITSVGDSPYKDEIVDYVIDISEKVQIDEVYSIQNTGVSEYKIGYFDKDNNFVEKKFVGKVKFIKEDKIIYNYSKKITKKDIKDTMLVEDDLNGINKTISKKSSLSISEKFKDQLIKGEVIFNK